MYSSDMGMDSHDMMDIDGWRPRIAPSMSYNSGSQPPSIGDVRQIDDSEPSYGIPMDSDGQPPSVTDVGRREASQSEASFTRYEGPDALEVQQHNLELQLACDGYLFNSSAIQIDFNDIPEDPCEQVYKEMETAGRLRWMNNLHPNIRRGNLSYEEKEKIIQLHSELGNKWSTIAAHLPGRSDDEIKNFVFLRWLLQKFSEIQHRTDSDLVSLTNTLGRKPSCEKNDGLRKGQWTVEEDLMLVRCINQYGFANWRKLSKYAGFKEVETAAG